MNNQLKVNLLSANSQKPVYKTKGAAGFDISTDVNTSVTIPPTSSKVFSTGLAFEIPEDYVMLVFSRSGHGFNNDIRLSNCVGVIDSDYRGELKIKLHNDGVIDYTVAPFERIAQGVMVHAKQFDIVEVDSISETERGSGGYGSTGK
jgi:dUTP pyrophosphatase